MAGDLTRLERLVRRLPGIDLNEEIDGTHLIEMAAAKGLIPIVYFLISHGVDLNACSPRHHNALLAAASNRHVGVVQLLLQCGADPAAVSPHSPHSLLALAPTLPWLQPLIVAYFPEHTMALDAALLAHRALHTPAAPSPTASSPTATAPLLPNELIGQRHFVHRTHPAPFPCLLCNRTVLSGQESYALAASPAANPLLLCVRCFDLFLRGGLLLNEPLRMALDCDLPCRFCRETSLPQRFTFHLPPGLGFLCSPCFLIWANSEKHAPEDRARFELREGNGFCDWCFSWFSLDPPQLGWIYPEKGVLYCTSCWALPFGQAAGVAEGLRAEKSGLETAAWDAAVEIALDYLEQQQQDHPLRSQRPLPLPHPPSPPNIPPAEPQWSTLLGHHLWVSAIQGDSTLKESVDTAQHLAAAQLVGLYFAGSWSHSSCDLLPVLERCYAEIRSRGIMFEVVYVSSDETAASFETSFATMPWAAVPYEQSDLRQALNRKFFIRRNPSFVILDSNQTILRKNAHLNLQIDPSGEQFPWLPGPKATRFYTLLEWLMAPHSDDAADLNPLLLGVLAHALFSGVGGLEEDQVLAGQLARMSRGNSGIGQVLLGIMEDPVMIQEPFKAHHPYALWAMGKILEGQGEWREAIACYGSAGLFGCSASCLQLYEILKDGTPVTNPDRMDALRWLARAEKRGCVRAQAKRGALLLEEEESQTEGLKVLHEAADLHHDMFAMTSLAVYYEQSHELAKALAYHQLCVDSNEMNACASLVRIGLAYEHGEAGYPLDLTRAHRHYYKASILGYPEALKHLTEIKLKQALQSTPFSLVPFSSSSNIDS